MTKTDIEMAVDAQARSTQCTRALQGKPREPAAMIAAGRSQLAAVRAMKAVIRSRGGDPKGLYAKPGEPRLDEYLRAEGLSPS